MAKFRSSPSTHTADAKRSRSGKARCTDPTLAANGVAFLQFSLSAGTSGVVTLDFNDSKEFRFDKGLVVDASGNVLASFDSKWTWERSGAHAKLELGETATVAIATKFGNRAVASQGRDGNCGS